jgi:dUTP pyrophosphatase
MMIDSDVYVKFLGNRPHQGTSGAAAYDLIANSPEDFPVIIPPGEWRVISTGTSVEIPPGFAGLILPRSGLAAKNGVTVLNSPGLIDSDYRGDIGVILHNVNKARDFAVTKGMRIAQLMVIRIPDLVLVAGQQLSDTVRGAGGFGSTGTQ